ncbi:HK97 family phage major capsid protein [Mycolicibacterium sp. BK634]|uniref:phage major capsid protein n=1 Tax=Mycolicibacterium sp. BK634 TaxID=2587099 RepID=UPI00161ECEA1|nr:phage major capsid protein [Mycolicibacterium sp. BK634]MBB3752602.1 HK97 family phage major capsid protein [Mycolicibacterium sp. BK634]
MDKIKQLQEARAAALAALDAALDARKAITDKVEAEGRQHLTEDETADLATKRSEVQAAKDLVKDLDAQISDAQDDAERSGRNDAETRRATTAVTEVKEPPTYEKYNGNSYFQDFALTQLNRADEGAKERLRRHVIDVDTSKELRKWAKVGDEFRNLDRNDGTGGEFVPPLWVMEEFAEVARSGRPYANLVPNRPLPPKTDSISIPKVLTGTATEIQTADNANISEVDLTTTSYSAGVKTIAGMQGLSLQALEQSPLSFDDIIFSDLAADYAVKLNRQVISGSGSGNQVVGVRATPSIVTITATDAGTELSKSQTVYKKIGDAIQRVHTSRYLSPQVIVMHPRRWQAFCTLFTSDGRLAIVPDGAGVNQIGVFENVAPENVVGRLQGLPVVVDPNMPTTLGAGTNQDVVHVLRASDLHLYESSVRTGVFTETRAEGLTVLLRLHGYLAFSAARYPQSVVEIGGTALTAPTFA